MQNLKTLLRSYRATLKSNRNWSRSKDYALDALLQDLGNNALTDITKQRLVLWGLASDRGACVKRVMLCTLSDVFRVAAVLWSLPVDRSAPKDALAALTLAGAAKSAGQRSQRVSDADLNKIGAAWVGKIDKRLPQVLIDTCLRVSELSSLHLSDVTPETIHLRRRKGGKPQTIPNLSPYLRARAGEDAPVTLYSGASISQAFKRSATRAGLSHIRTHDLRHEGISRLFERGLTIPQVAAVSGHKTWQMLERYTHIDPASVLDAANR
jgi:integrase